MPGGGTGREGGREGVIYGYWSWGSGFQWDLWFNWVLVGQLQPHPHEHKLCSLSQPVKKGAGMLSPIILFPLLPDTPPNFLGAPFLPASTQQYYVHTVAVPKLKLSDERAFWRFQIQRSILLLDSVGNIGEILLQ
ncbi:MAG: hypothetical protein GY820_08080 [Gammaproteobacteria bacterium]|nr:hypothetical protein [Gammaproteobacteria bacterium]